jgi:peptidoglycan hydrolase-like protein with peptidoglycan-binding domain
MRRSHLFAAVGGILLVAALFFALTFNAFGATRSTHSGSRASASTHTVAFARLALNSCPKSCPNPINNCPPLLEHGGYTGTWVQVLDYRLNDIGDGGTPLSISSTFTAATTTAVTDYQLFVGITPDGKVGNQTWTSLGFCVAGDALVDLSGTGGTHCPGGLSYDPTKVLTWVNALQDLVNVEFYQSGVGEFSTTSPERWTPYLSSDGVFGAQTEAAVSDFQAYVGQSYTGGAVGNTTWSNLLMCY